MAATAMVLIQELYAVERLARDQNRSGGGLDADQIKELRLEKSLPKYNRIGGPTIGQMDQ